MTEPNVLLVVMDSVRARNTSIHGHQHNTTPEINGLTDTATLYRQARAPSQWSLPSHASIFTGLHVPEHGVTRDSHKLQQGKTLFDDLLELGYETGVFSENPYLASLDTGLASGFETIVSGAQEPPFDGLDPGEYKGRTTAFLRAAIRSGNPVRSMANGLVSKVAWDHPGLIPDRFKRRLAAGTTPGSVYTNNFLQWLDGREGPWAACINYMDAHHPYQPAAEFDRWDDGALASVQQSIGSLPLSFYTGDDPWWRCEVLTHLYDGTIRQIDHEVGRLVQALRERNAFDDTLLVVASDHGEGFGEQSPIRELRIAGHNVGEHEVNLHVPLVIKHPEQSEPAMRESPVSLTAIPDVVEQALGGDDGPYDLEEKNVIARTGGLREVQQDRLRDEGINLGSFQGTSDILYEMEDGTLRKRIAWKDRTATTACIDAQTSYAVDQDDRQRVPDVFDRLKDTGVRREKSRRSINAATERHLEELGYR